jgi:hypothetical protein
MCGPSDDEPLKLFAPFFLDEFCRNAIASANSSSFSLSKKDPEYSPKMRGHLRTLSLWLADSSLCLPRWVSLAPDRLVSRQEHFIEQQVPIRLGGFILRCGGAWCCHRYFPLATLATDREGQRHGVDECFALIGMGVG